MSAAENVLVLLLLAILIVPVLLVWYAYNREESGDLEHALSYWFGGIPGLFFYREYSQAQGNQPDSVRQCPECQSTHAEEVDFCERVIELFTHYGQGIYDYSRLSIQKIVHSVHAAQN